MKRSMNIRIGIILFVCIITAPAFAQRKGAVETGGFFAFRSTHQPDSTMSAFDIEWSFGFYRSKDFYLEIQPAVQVDILNNDYLVSSQVMAATSYRLFDLAAAERGEEYSYSVRSRRISAGVFGFFGAGFWMDGYKQGLDNANSSIGPAFSLGITSHSLLSTVSLLKTRIQYVYLAPAGELYDFPRSLFKIGVGFSFFLRI